MDSDYITISEACQLLDISIPTLNVYRKKYDLQSFPFKRRRIYFSKLEIIEKIVYPRPITKSQKIKVTALSETENLASLFVSEDIVDLRGDISLDAFAIISLLCKLKEIIKVQGKNIYLLVENSSFCRDLKSLGFFNELERSNSTSVYYNKGIIMEEGVAHAGQMLWPLHTLGYKGAEKKIVGDLYGALIEQGFSDQLSGYLGWVIGELSDNCHTHSRGNACYLMVESKNASAKGYKFLSIVIGDTGIGIHHSLKSNEKYKELSDRKAFVSAFRSHVSSWPDECKRGKGLNDVLTISIGNESWIRCESEDISLHADFINGGHEFKFVETIGNTKGTRIGIILIDNTFNDITRENADSILNEFLEMI